MDIGYVHQNLQLKKSATYPAFPARRNFACIVKWRVIAIVIGKQP